MTTDDAHLSATGSATRKLPDRSTWRYLKDMQLPPDVQQMADRICKEWKCRKPADRQHVEENIKLQHFFGGQDVAYMTTPEGLLIVCVGDLQSEEFSAALDWLPREERRQITIYCPPIWNEFSSSRRVRPMKRKIRLVPRVVAGVDCPSPEVTLGVRDRYGAFAPIRFVVDTGADLCGLPIPLAQKETIPFPQTEEARGRAGGLVGAVDKYLGTIHVRIAGEEFDWPCNFLAAPTSHPAGGRSPQKYGVLGRGAVFAAFRMLIDDPYLTIERRTNDRPWWYRLGRSLLPRRAVAHPVGVPL